MEPVAGWVGEAGCAPRCESGLAWLAVIIPLHFGGELQLKHNITT